MTPMSEPLQRSRNRIVLHGTRNDVVAVFYHPMDSQIEGIGGIQGKSNSRGIGDTKHPSSQIAGIQDDSSGF
jgi:hypothetical protein